VAFGLEVTGKAPNDQEADINPQHSIGVHVAAESGEGLGGRQDVFEVDAGMQACGGFLTCLGFGYSLGPFK
jgi:hypothetical protein